MEHSVIDKISGNSIRFYYEGWRNGKKGAISLIGGVYRFIELTRSEHGSLDDLHENMENNPVVAVGIVAYWLMYKCGKHNIITRLSGFITPHPIRQIFDKYTNDYFIHFTNIHSDNPDAWNWDWDYEFYAKYIIPLAVSQNRISEALFDYISDEDIKLVRSVMRNYVQYLKQVRLEKGYKDIPELKVLRSIDSQNVDMLEDMEDNEIITILDSLEEKGYVKVAWVEGHSPEDIRILDKGRAYMKQLEAEEREKGESLNDLPDVLNTKLAVSIFSKCIQKGWMKKTDSGYHWIGIKRCNGSKSQLAYLCGKIYGFKSNGISGNSGNEFPNDELCQLFNENNIYKSLVQVYSAKKPQKWRGKIDELFD